jgi:hypothetical protein
MTTEQIIALAWIPVGISLVIGFAFMLVLRDDRAERRKPPHAAE